MRVVMVGPFGMAPKSTMAARALPMAAALSRRGHSVTIVLPPWSNPSAAGTTTRRNGVLVINLPLPLRLPLVFQALLTIGLLRHALALHPDVVHCFKPKAYAGLVAWCLWWLKKLGLVRARLVIDSDDWEGDGGWNDVERYPWLLKRFFAWQEQWGLTHSDGVTVASRALQTLVWGLGVPRGRVWYVPNGVEDGSGEMPVQASSEPVRPVVLLYTRFVEFRLERIERLFVQLGEAYSDLQFEVIGTGLSHEEQRLARQLQDTRVGQRVTWQGWPPPGGLAGALARATVAVFPFDDTLLNRTKCSVRLCEILLNGIPVVADAVGQNAEYIVHGESGLLAPPEDEAAFFDAVRKLLEDAALRQKLGACAQCRMRTCFGWSKLVEEVERAYAA